MGRKKKDVTDDTKAENRARQAAYKQKMKDAGCKPLTIWAHESKIDLLKATLQEICPMEGVNSPFKQGDKPIPALIASHNRAICRENDKIQAYFGKFIDGIPTLKGEKTLLDTVQTDVIRLLLPLLGDFAKRQAPSVDTDKPAKPVKPLSEAALERRRERDRERRKRLSTGKPRGRPRKIPDQQPQAEATTEPQAEPQAELELSIIAIDADGKPSTTGKPHPPRHATPTE
jgi:hypothetical protein